MTTMTLEPSTLTSELLTLINYVEVWTLPATDESESQSVLQLDHAYVIGREDVRRLDSTGRNGLGEGIAGSAWKQQRPVILQGENSAVLQHVIDISGLPIEVLLAIPVYRDYQLVNVVVFGLTAGCGGVEIWSRDDRDELAISGSYYEGLSSFEFISQYVRFPKGAGVPGACWKDGRPRIIAQPHAAPNFIRSFDKDPAQLSQCIGLPIGREYGFAGSVILLLSDEAKPLARNFNLWQCESSTPTEGDTNPAVRFTSSSLDTSDLGSDWCQSVCDRVAIDRQTLLLTSGSDGLPVGFRFGVVIPFFCNESIDDLAVLLF